jgi:hypothetical protein
MYYRNDLKDDGIYFYRWHFYSIIYVRPRLAFLGTRPGEVTHAGAWLTHVWPPDPLRFMHGEAKSRYQRKEKREE